MKRPGFTNKGLKGQKTSIMADREITQFVAEDHISVAGISTDIELEYQF